MLCDTMLMFFLLGVVPLLVILIFVVISRMKDDTKIVTPSNKQKEKCNDDLDKELREAFLKEYIDSNCCVWVKLKTLPKSFKIGNVYFDKCVEDICYYQEFLSYAVIDDKIYDNGNISVSWDSFSYFRVNNKDLMNYILDNLDKVEEVKQ